MFELQVNGKTVSADQDKTLLSFLRDDLKITSAKDGCSEGACGTCTVLVNNKAVKACAQKVSKFVGKSILTVEGLSRREREVYEYCFGAAGAVQCGFCIPGMVICAKALLDENPDPTGSDVKKAIRGNICRCTGYKKIEEAILMAGKFFRESLEIPKEICSMPKQCAPGIPAPELIKLTSAKRWPTRTACGFCCSRTCRTMSSGI